MEKEKETEATLWQNMLFLVCCQKKDNFDSISKGKLLFKAAHFMQVSRNGRGNQVSRILPSLQKGMYGCCRLPQFDPVRT